MHRKTYSGSQIFYIFNQAFSKNKLSNGQICKSMNVERLKVIFYAALFAFTPDAEI